MTRSRKKIKLSIVRKYAQLQCTMTEIAAGCEVSLKTFNKARADHPIIDEVIAEGREQGKISLRRKQHRLASTSAQMAIHMGKQYLGQKDIVVNEITGKDGGPISTVDVGKLSAEERQELRSLITRSTKSE